MSNVVDNRVVEMDFDNGGFEQGVGESLKSINALKKGLNFDGSEKSLNNLMTAGRNFNLDGMADGVSNISSKFSALGVVGFTILQNLTNSAINLGQKMVDAYVRPAREGFAEYEQGLNAFQTIFANTKSSGATMQDVNKTMAELNDYANKTIYSYGDMTKAAGLFTAQGVKLGDTVKGIKGIYNIISLTGGDANKANSAIYQLSQAIASGTVRAQDWISVVNAGIGGKDFQNQLEQTARIHGVKVDEMIKKQGSFRESLQEGWLSSEILLETLTQYTGDLSETELKSIGYSEEQIKQIQELGRTATESATKLKTWTQVVDMLKSNTVTGWAQSFKIVFGDLNEAYELWSFVGNSVSSILQEGTDARNKLLQDWKDLGGRTNILSALERTFWNIMDVIKIFKEAFREIIPPITAEKLHAITLDIALMAEHMRLSDENSAKLKTIFKGLASVIDIVRMAIGAVVGHLFNFGKAMKPAAGGVFDFLVKMADWVIKLRDAIKTNDIFNKSIDKFIGFILTAKERIAEFAKVVADKFAIVKEWFQTTFSKISESFSFKGVDTSGIKSFLDKIHLRFEPLTKLAEFVAKVFTGIGSIIKTIAPVVFKIGGAVGKFVENLVTELAKGLGNLDFNNIFDSLNGGLLAALLVAIRQFVTGGSGVLGEVKSIIGGVSGVLDGVRGSLEAWQQSLKAKTLITIAIAIGILTASLVVLSMIDSKKLTIALAAVTTMMLELVQAMSIFSKISGGSGKGMATLTFGLIGLSVALLIMSAAVSNLAKIDPKQMFQAMVGIEAMILMLVEFSKVMSKNSGGLVKGALGLIIFAGALEIMVDVVKKLGAMDSDQLIQGLEAVGALLAGIAIFLKVTDLSGMGIRSSVGILILAGAIAVLAVSVQKFAAMDQGTLVQGLSAVAVVLGEVAIFVNATGDSKKVIATAIGMTILGAAMLIFSEAISRMGNLSWEQLARGMAAMAGSLIIMFAAVKAFPKSTMLTGAGLVVLASSLVILAEALKSMGGMSWEEIGRGLTVLSVSMVILAAGMYAMEGALPGAAALLVISAALAIFAPVMKTLGSMSLGEIGMGLLALAGAFAILGIAGTLLTPMVPTLLGLGGAMLLFGLAITAVGVGVLAFSTGMAALAVSGAAGAVALTVIITTILGIIPAIVRAIVGAVIQFAQLIAQAAPTICNALKVTLLALIDVLVAVTPPLLDALGLLLSQLIDLLIEMIPKFMEALDVLIGSLLQTLTKNIPRFIKAGLDIIMALLKGIRDNIGQMVTVAIDIVTRFCAAIAARMPDIVQAGFDLILAFINSLADGVDANIDALNEAVGHLVTAIIDGLVKGILAGVTTLVEAIKKLIAAAVGAFVAPADQGGMDINSPSKVTTKFGEYMGEGLVNGILSYVNPVRNASTRISQEAVKSMSDAIGGISDALSGNMEMNPTIRPVLDLSEVISGSSQLDGLFAERSLAMSASIAKSETNRAKATATTPETGTSNQNQGGTTISLTQYNNSPKALDRIEIYRQTRNQLHTLKGLVKNT